RAEDVGQEVLLQRLPLVVDRRAEEPVQDLRLGDLAADDEAGLDAKDLLPVGPDDHLVLGLLLTLRHLVRAARLRLLRRRGQRCQEEHWDDRRFHLSPAFFFCSSVFFLPSTAFCWCWMPFCVAAM